MKIGGWIKTSLIEWPGKISSVIFVVGCNFRCPFCYNSFLVDPQKNTNISLISEKKIFDELSRRQRFVEGVVVSGGEPTLQSDLLEFLRKTKNLGFQTMIETNGSNPQIIDNLLTEKLLDYIAVDYKTIFENYGEVVGNKDFVSRIWLETIQVILERKIPFEIRTTIVPGIHELRVLKEMAIQLKKVLGDSSEGEFQGWFWQNFRPQNCLNPQFEKKSAFKKEKLEEFLNEVKRIFSQVYLRTS